MAARGKNCIFSVDPTLEEVTQVITWLTGYTAKEIEKAAAGSVTCGDFFRNAPQLNPNRKLS